MSPRQCSLDQSSIYSVSSVCLFLSQVAAEFTSPIQDYPPTRIYFSSFIYGALICSCYSFFRLLICCLLGRTDFAQSRCFKCIGQCTGPVPDWSYPSYGTHSSGSFYVRGGGGGQPGPSENNAK